MIMVDGWLTPSARWFLLRPARGLHAGNFPNGSATRSRKSGARIRGGGRAGSFGIPARHGARDSGNIEEHAMYKAKATHTRKNSTAPVQDLTGYWPLGQQRFASAMAEITAEMMRFASRRFDAHAKALKACASASDMSQLLGVQRDYLSDLASDYSNESAEIMRRTQELMVADWPAAKPD
jgi:hypothetical protein